MDIFDILLARAGNSGGGGGGGGGGVEPKDVNLIDYDGTILHAYTKQEFAALEALPDNPSHDGLVEEGWNWTLADAKAQAATGATVWIGQVYKTASGATEIDLHITAATRNPYINLGVNGTASIDWGDGTTADSVTGSSVTTLVATGHTYTAAGDYTVKITAGSGSEYALVGSSATPNRGCVSAVSTATSQAMCAYGNTVNAIRTASGALIGTYACYKFGNIGYLSIASGITGVGTYAFRYCYALKAITLPNTFTSLSNYAINGESSLQYVSLPGSGIGTIYNYGLADNHVLASCTIPPSTTTLSPSAFTTNYTVKKAVIPAGVTSIGANAFYANYTLQELHFVGAAPPTVANSSAFSDLPISCVIYVPTGKKATYTGASNYPDDEVYTYREE